MLDTVSPSYYDPPLWSVGGLKPRPVWPGLRGLRPQQGKNGTEPILTRFGISHPGLAVRSVVETI